MVFTCCCRIVFMLNLNHCAYLSRTQVYKLDFHFSLYVFESYIVLTIAFFKSPKGGTNGQRPKGDKLRN